MQSLNPSTIPLHADAKDKANIFAFEGFNAESVVKAIEKRMLAVGIKTAEAVEQELLDMIYIGLSRGNIRDPSVKRTGTAGATRILELAKRYKILLRKKKGETMPRGNNDISFVRVVQCYPTFVAKYLGMSILPPPTLNYHKWNVNGLPLAMKSTSFASLLAAFKSKPDDEVYRAVRLAGIAWSMCFDVTINDAVKVPRPDNVSHFFDMGLNYDLQTGAMLQQVLLTFGVCSTKAIHPRVKEVAGAVLAEFPSLDATLDLSGVEDEPKLDVAHFRHSGKALLPSTPVQ
jgi:hypothetical protein